MSPRFKQLAERALVLLLIGLVAVFSLSSWWVACFVGALTILAVLYDIIAQARADDPLPTTADATPQSFTIDLSRRP